MTGAWDCTPDHLLSMVEAERDPAVRAPVLKLGHIDPRFDGQPAVGRLANLRLSDDGLDLYADAVGVPGWLAEIWGSAFPSRSIEAALDCTDAQGRKHKAVLTGLALLGVQPPAIESLEDIRALYDGDLVAASTLMAQGTAVHFQPAPPIQERRMPKWLSRLVSAAKYNADELQKMLDKGQALKNDAGMPAFPIADEEDLGNAISSVGRSKMDHDTVRKFIIKRAKAIGKADAIPDNWKSDGSLMASVAIDDVYSEFYENVPQGSYAWVRQVFSDYLLVDDGDGNLYQLPWSEVDGDVSFGEPVAGTMVFVPKVDDESDDHPIQLAGDREGALALLSHDPTVADRRVQLAAGVPTQTNDDQEVDLDITELLAEVGLPADATAEQYREQLAALASIAREGSGEQSKPPTTPSIPEGMSLVDSTVLEDLRVNASRGADADQRLRDRDREEFLARAVKLGKIPPARLDAYRAMWQADEESARSTIDSLAEGLVPVSVSMGHAGDSGMGSDDDDFYRRMFGDEGSQS